MLVLEIILGVLLAVLVLLCVPAGVEASWQEVPGQPVPPQRPPQWENDPQLAAAAAYLREQGLWPQAPPPPPDHQARVWVRWGPVRIQVYPPKPGSKRPKPQPKEPPAEEPNTPKPKKKSLSAQLQKLEEGLELARKMLEAAKPSLAWALGDLRMNLALSAVIGGEDSAQVAEDYGRLCAAVTALLAAAHNLVRLEHRKVDIRPDFLAADTHWNAQVRAIGHPIVWLAAALRFGAVFLWRMFQDEKQQASPVDRKDR